MNENLMRIIKSKYDKKLLKVVLKKGTLWIKVIKKYH